MSRSTGTFPAYSKLKLNPDEFPKGYWDSSVECKECGTLWPNTHLFTPTICCGKGSRIVETAPDMRWPEAVSALHEKRFNDLYERWNEGLTDEQLAKVEEVKKDPVKKTGMPRKPKIRPYQGVGH